MLRSLVRHAHFGGGSPSQAPFRKAAEKVTIGAGSSSGRIALRNAVEKSMISRSLSETAPRVLSLHRDFLRAVPWIKGAYYLPMEEQASALPCRSLRTRFSSEERRARRSPKPCAGLRARTPPHRH